MIRWDGPAYDGKPWVPAFKSPEWEAWDGRHPAEMFWYNGRNSRFERLTFDGWGMPLQAGGSSLEAIKKQEAFPARVGGQAKKLKRLACQGTQDVG